MFGETELTGEIDDLHASSQQKKRALILLDGERRVVFLSAAAQRWMDGKAVLGMRAGRLRLLQSARQEELESAMQTCLESHSSVVLSLTPADGEPVALLVCTVQPRNNSLSPTLGLVSVSIVGAERPVSEDHSVVASSLGLTGSESRIAVLIARGQRPAQIAGEIGLSVHTVRHHIKNIYRKTGAHSQSQLTAMVLNLLP